MSMKNLPIATFAVAIMVVTGCNNGPQVAAKVDPQAARAALTSTLDAWKAGKAIESLASASPPIVAQDFDWMQGKKLSKYEALGEGTPQDANLRVEVNLTLEGDANPKKVAYIIGTSPKLTVFRAFE